jgi:sensor histidine kinase YesM
MNDAYVELLVKRKTSKAALMLKSFLYALGVVSIALSVLTMAPFFILLGLIFFGVGYVVQYAAMTEYEYLFLDRHLSIDRIRNQSRRKQVADYDLTNMEIIAPVTSHQLDHYRSENVKKIDFSTHSKDSKPYAMVLRDGSVCKMILIEMNEELLKQFSMLGPRKVFTD